MICACCTARSIMISGKINLILKAIRQKREIMVENTENNEIRIVKPFVLYSHLKDNKTNILLNGFQVTGDSDSGNPEGWKNIIIGNKIKIAILPITFEVEPKMTLSERFKNVMASVFN